MKIKHLTIIFTFLFTILTFSIFAQQKTQIRGTVLEGSSQQPVEFATIMVADKATKKAITGATTDLDGKFNVETDATDFYLEISFIGFKSRIIEDIEIVNGVADIGTIKMGEDSQTLDEVVVRAEKSSTEFKLDKRVFNVGKDLSSTGASALEVLNNVPSVNVNIEGDISLRGSEGVQVLINGKPSVIASESGNALGTITAEMIDKIEVITNPSAKYDAEGTSGIINIVIKKEERKGINGSATVNVGAPHNHSFGLSLNRRTEKFNLFSQMGVGYRSRPNERESINQNFARNTTLSTIGDEFRNELFYNFIVGADYNIDKYSVLTLSGSFAYEIEDQPSLTDFVFSDETGVVDRWQREEVTEATNPKYQYELQYKRDFKDDKDHSILFSAIGNLFAKDQSSEFLNTTIEGNNRDLRQRTATDFGELRQTFKLDYTKPLNDNWTIETGAQYVLQHVDNDFSVENFADNEWVADPNLTNVFEFDQNVLGVYGTGAYEDDRWGVKLGLRMENTDLSTLLVTTDEGNKRNFTDFFPTLHTSYKLTDNFSLQAGYSRRIYRPRMWSLNPFFNIRNDFNIRTGNPNLLPEYTDSYEITSIYILGEVSMNFGVYHRYTTDVVERISILEGSVSTTTPFNIGSNRSTGVEFNFKYSPTKKWSMNGDFNYNYFNREGMFEATSFDFNADQWSSKLTNKIKLPAKFELEITGQYRSAVQTVQSEISANVFADLGIRKKIGKGRAVFSLSVRDVFASRFRESETQQADFYLYNYSRRGRFVTLGFSYGFGKGEAMEFSGRKRR
ncbi:MAG: TonB-dependent receptor [Saprospiraceae bacterium]